MRVKNSNGLKIDLAGIGTVNINGGDMRNFADYRLLCILVDQTAHTVQRYFNGVYGNSISFSGTISFTGSKMFSMGCKVGSGVPLSATPDAYYVR